ncbi:MAG: histidinol-phosphate aminotransferase [Acidimicrobiales bacterium]|jgi:histidinol-phosphate aminotransferase
MPAYRPGKDASQAEAEHGIADAIKLASNETPWGPVPSVVQKIADAAAGINRYADHRATVVRERLAQSLTVNVDQVTVGCGSVGILQQLALTYVNPGDEVLYPWRSFEVYPVFTKLVDGVEVTVPLKEHAFDLEAVAQAVTGRTKLILLANPNNPTGTARPMSEIKTLLETVRDDVIVVLDEAYKEFMSPELGESITDLLPHHDNLVILRTFSKAQGLAALRVGYGIGHPDVIESVDKTLFPFAVNGLAQTAAIASIDANVEVMERVEFIRGERNRVVAALLAAGWRLPEPEANFVYLPLGATTDDVYLDLEKKGVVTRPFTGEGIRVTIGSADENDRFLNALLG